MWDLSVFENEITNLKEKTEPSAWTGDELDMNSAPTCGPDLPVTERDMNSAPTCGPYLPVTELEMMDSPSRWWIQPRSSPIRDGRARASDSRASSFRTTSLAEGYAVQFINSGARSTLNFPKFLLSPSWLDSSSAVATSARFGPWPAAAACGSGLVKMGQIFCTKTVKFKKLKKI